MLPGSPDVDDDTGRVDFVLTRSAQDFAGALVGRGRVVAASSASAGLTSVPGCTAVEEASPADNGTSAVPVTFVDVDAALTETL